MSEPIKHDKHKLPMHLISPMAVEELARALRHGAEKYGERNWEPGLKYSRLYAAAQRHLVAWWGGEDLDPETGETHIAHAFATMMMLTHFTRQVRTDLDDRPDPARTVRPDDRLDWASEEEI